MPLDEFVSTAQALGKSGYRPVRFRPCADGPRTRVAAVWARDRRNWRISSGLTALEVRQQDDRNQKENFLPVDVTGYETSDKGSRTVDRYAALWVEKSVGDEARMYVGATADEQDEIHEKFEEAKLIPRTQAAMIGAERRTRYSGVWGLAAGADVTGQTARDQFEGNFEQTKADLSDQLLLDVAVNMVSKRQPVRERAQDELEIAKKKFKTRPDLLYNQLARAVANLRIGENQKALDDLQVVVGKWPASVAAQQYRVIAIARLGLKQDAAV